jgi:serine/threonine protein kinase
VVNTPPHLDHFLCPPSPPPVFLSSHLPYPISLNISLAPSLDKVAGKVCEIKRRRDDRWFALKTLEFKNMTIREARAIVTELLALNRIPSHPFVIQLHAAFRGRFSLSFVMELLVGGDLRLLLRLDDKLDETKIAYVVACVGSALRHIHLRQVIHRDVKPENIMFTSRGIPKLIDFGIAHLSPPSSKICICQGKSGTIQYMSPEALVPRTHCHGYETDFWSLGVVMYELLYLTRPYETRVPSQLVQYSEETYEAKWKSLLAESSSEFGTCEFASSAAVSSLLITRTLPAWEPILSLRRPWYFTRSFRLSKKMTLSRSLFESLCQRSHLP